MPPTRWTGSMRALRPMLATLTEHPLNDPAFVYEPKYDGIRAIAIVEPGRGEPSVTLVSRLGNDKSSQFPEIVRALQRFAAKRTGPLVLDGEIVALDAAGHPAGFQQLQGRIHVSTGEPPSAPVAFILFDILRDGDDDLRDLPLTERRQRLERLVGRSPHPVIRVSEQVAGDGRDLWARAQVQGWEGLIGKRADSVYRTGKRSPEWVKLKLVYEQEFVIGGWTEPRGTRPYFGALLLGVYRDDGTLEYVGHTGTGFDEKELARVFKALKPLETPTCPFRERPRPNERPHWTKPELVAEVKFTEWTADSKLRHPTYLGLRDDVRPENVRREPAIHPQAPRRRRETSARSRAATRARAAGAPSRNAASGSSAAPTSPGRKTRAMPARIEIEVPPARRGRASARRGVEPEMQVLIDALRDLEERRADGAITLPGGHRLEVGNLHKVFWPASGLTKGDLLRYYVSVAPVLLPVVADRALVMKRFPNGIEGKSFYQQRAPDKVPAGVRVEQVRGDTEVPSRVVGGTLMTLLYMAQLAVVSQDPWFSRVSAPATPDYVALDLDPMPDVPFATVLDVARWVRDELALLGAVGFPKTSGADGLHIYIPLPEGTPYEAGLIYCQIVATMVSTRHPKVATVERTVRARGSRVYIDYLQNIEGKTLACAYSARASDYAGVSTPLTWKEVDGALDRRDFTIRTLPSRLAAVGDLWAGLARATPVDLHAVERYSG